MKNYKKSGKTFKVGIPINDHKKEEKAKKLDDSLSAAQKQILEYPDLYREYLYLEGFFCDSRSMATVPRDKELPAIKRLNELFTFFKFEDARSRFGTAFWNMKQAA